MSMQNSIAIALVVGLSFVACDKEDTKTAGPPNAVESSEPAGAEEPPEPLVEQESKEASTPSSDAKGSQVNLDAVHAHLKAGKKLDAVKEYRSVHGNLSLAASKLGVEVEQKKLGLPSTLDVHALYFAGNKEGALQAMAAHYKLPVADERVQRLWGRIDEIGPATPDNLAAQAAAGKSSSALAIYHQLHPDTPIPEAWKAVEALMAK